jgi:hypothetical protein
MKAAQTPESSTSFKMLDARCTSFKMLDERTTVPVPVHHQEKTEFEDGRDEYLKETDRSEKKIARIPVTTIRTGEPNTHTR